jgi:mono/diheme cytochrome c family protein
MRSFNGARMFVAMVAAGGIGVTLALSPQAQTLRTVQDGVYSDAQAARGAALYTSQCAGCHGDALGGLSAPPLAGDAFVQNWRSQPLAELVNKIRNTMPQGSPGSLTPQQSADIVAHMLKVGRFPAGGADLAGNEAAWKQIGWPAAAAQAPAFAAAAPGIEFPPATNMAQLMRGLYFANANLIFTVQTRDPGAPSTPAPSADSAAGFSFVDWGAGIYTGWQLVDNSALTLADASTLMLTPGRRCENGRPVPVGDPDWIRYTREMYDVAMATYKASQSRNQEAVSDITGDLSDACSNCHRAYRDRPAGGRGRGRGGAPPAPGDPAANAGRCVSLVTPDAAR